MERSRTRIAIIGMGMWGARAHLPAIADNPGAEVAALVDQDRDLASRIGEPYGITRIETDAGALFRDPSGIDAVVIATPDDTHRDLAIAAFAAGLHVLCEKPLAFDLPQAIEMAGAARASGRAGKLGFLSRFSPVVRKMKELVDSGAIGTIQAVECHTVNAQFIDPARPLHWKMQKKRANGGVSVEYGSHAIDLALWFGGPITRVVGHATTVVSERLDAASGEPVRVDVDDISSWLAEYKRGGEASFRMSWASLPVGGGGLRIYGSTGSLAWHQDLTGRRTESLIAASIDRPEPHTLFEYSPQHDPRFDEGVFPLGLLARYNAGLIESFLRDIASGESTGPNFADGLGAQYVLDALGRSLDTRAWAEVADQSASA